MPRQFILPDLGEGITEAQVIRVLVKAGEVIKEDQIILEVETDKAAVEIPSPYGGKLDVVHVEEGQLVHVGDTMLTFEGGGEASAPAEKPEADAKAPASVAAKAPASASTGPATSGASTPAPVPAQAASDKGKVVPAAPAVRRLAREMGIDLHAVTASGPAGRVLREDLERHAAGGEATVSTGAPSIATPAGASPAPEVMKIPSRPVGQVTPLPDGKDDSDSWGEIRRVGLRQIRKTIADQMSKSMYTAPHVTHMDDADISELERIRRDLNEATGGEPKLTAMSFIIRAVCVALRKYPILNSSFDHENGEIIYKKYINVGIAVDTDRGLIVPVIRNADKLGLAGIASELRSIAERVRVGQFAIEDLRGGTFTLTNVGALGGRYSTPVINYPEVAILGLGRTRREPVLRDGELKEAMMLPLSMSFDHRATDGANAARFTREIIAYLEQPTKFLLL